MPEFPPKSLMNTSRKFLEQRRLQLDRYMQEVAKITPMPQALLNFLDISIQNAHLADTYAGQYFLTWYSMQCWVIIIFKMKSTLAISTCIDVFTCIFFRFLFNRSSHMPVVGFKGRFPFLLNPTDPALNSRRSKWSQDLPDTVAEATLDFFYGSFSWQSYLIKNGGLKKRKIFTQKNMNLWKYILTPLSLAVITICLNWTMSQKESILFSFIIKV